MSAACVYVFKATIVKVKLLFLRQKPFDPDIACLSCCLEQQIGFAFFFWSTNVFRFEPISLNILK